MSGATGGRWAAEVAVALAAVREASQAIMRYYERNDAAVYTKGDASPVTDADLASDRIIRDHVGRHFPADALLTEEGADDPTRLAAARCWIADPIDGTQQFVDRTGEFDLFLALVVDGLPVVGVSAHPPSGQVLWAVAGEGAWIEEAGVARPLRFAPPPATPALVTGLYHGAPGNLPILERVARRAGIAQPVVSPCGFQPRSMLPGASGEPRYHLFVGLGSDPTGPNPSGGEWDFAAADLIVREAGGCFTDLRGSRLAYNKPDARNFGGLLAATGPELHARVLAALAAELTPFYPADAPVPTELRTGEFSLRPLRATDTPLDYDAVMGTQETLRLMSGGRWPRPGFTIEENRADLEGHEADFQARRGFTYTVLDPTSTRCLGCVYLYPLVDTLHRLNAGEATLAQVGDYEAVVWFWMRPECVAADLDRRLLAALLAWLRTAFAFTRVVFRTSALSERQTTLYRDAGLRLLWALPERDTQALFFS